MGWERAPRVGVGEEEGGIYEVCQSLKGGLLTDALDG